MSAAVLCGIDPGVTGALAFLREDGSVLAIEDMPVLITTTGRKQIDAYRLASILDDHKPITASIERVSARPGEGPVGAFNFGHGLGIVQGVLGARQTSYRLVQPATWKRSCGIPAGAPKEASVATAKQLIPSSAPYLTLVKHHGRADAVLIAHFGLTQQTKVTKGLE